jgi:LmbE family N-acetylglucosaminyl deacetylase
MEEKVLAVVAHPDDEILGCGGTLIKHILNSDKVKVVFTSDSESSRFSNIDNLSKRIVKRQEIAKKVSEKLNFDSPVFLNFANLMLSRDDITSMNKMLKDIILSYKPTIIYTHFPNDIHHDHRATYEATLVACRPLNKFKVKKIMTFEIPSATELSLVSNKINFTPSYFINIEKEIRQKMKILKYYRNELLKYPSIRSFEGVKNLNKYRGNMVNLKYAEAFEIVRFIDF